jgi:hypothetical protein
MLRRTLPTRPCALRAALGGRPSGGGVPTRSRRSLRDVPRSARDVPQQLRGPRCQAGTSRCQPGTSRIQTGTSRWSIGSSRGDSGTSRDGSGVPAVSPGRPATTPGLPEASPGRPGINAEAPAMKPPDGLKAPGQNGSLPLSVREPPLLEAQRHRTSSAAALSNWHPADRTGTTPSPS